MVVDKFSHPSQNNRRKAPLQPAKPRVLFLARDIGEQPEIDEQSDSILIASCKVSGKLISLWLSNYYLRLLQTKHLVKHCFILKNRFRILIPSFSSFWVTVIFHVSDSTPQSASSYYTLSSCYNSCIQQSGWKSRERATTWHVLCHGSYELC